MPVIAVQFSSPLNTAVVVQARTTDVLIASIFVLLYITNLCFYQRGKKWLVSAEPSSAETPNTISSTVIFVVVQASDRGYLETWTNW